MTLGELKPILGALALPPAAPLLLALAGLLLVLRRRPRAGAALAIAGLAGLWALSCHAVAMLLAATLLPPVAPLPADQLARAQAIVVLGGGVLRQAPEYGRPDPNGQTLARLRYGVQLARRSGRPLAFSGGIGWASVDGGIPAEAQAAAAALADDWGLVPRWLDGQSRDTAENAERSWALLSAAGVRRIALVTHAWHMPRAVLAFERAGFEVLPAPTGFASPQTRPLLEWLPSADGLALSRQVLREALALAVARLRPSR